MTKVTHRANVTQTKAVVPHDSNRTQARRSKGLPDGLMAISLNGRNLIVDTEPHGGVRKGEEAVILDWYGKMQVIVGPLRWSDNQVSGRNNPRLMMTPWVPDKETRGMSSDQVTLIGRVLESDPGVAVA